MSSSVLSLVFPFLVFPLWVTLFWPLDQRSEQKINENIAVVSGVQDLNKILSVDRQARERLLIISRVAPHITSAFLLHALFSLPFDDTIGRIAMILKFCDLNLSTFHIFQIPTFVYTFGLNSVDSWQSLMWKVFFLPPFERWFASLKLKTLLGWVAAST